MAEIIIYSKKICPYCDRAKQLLTEKGATYQEIMVDEEPHRLQEMMARTSRRTVPQIYIGDFHVGGFDDLAALSHSGKLDELLSK